MVRRAFTSIAADNRLSCCGVESVFANSRSTRAQCTNASYCPSQYWRLPLGRFKSESSLIGLCHSIFPSLPRSSLHTVGSKVTLLRLHTCTSVLSLKSCDPHRPCDLGGQTCPFQVDHCAWVLRVGPMPAYGCHTLTCRWGDVGCDRCVHREYLVAPRRQHLLL